MSDPTWQSTACCLCYANCGVQVKIGEDGRSITRVKGDKQHPISKGYTCNKAARIDYYQNARDRLTTPLRRKADGSFEPISWDTAIREIADRLATVRDTHGGERILYYGGGSQGNHLGGSYAGSLQNALGIQYHGNALSQEKTGLWWTCERMLGSLYHGDFEHCDVAVIVGKNPWQSNGIQRARIDMRDLSKADDRTLVVIDPRRTETADLADIHLAVRPGRDAWCLSAILGYLVQNGHANLPWLREHADGLDQVLDAFMAVPVEEYAEFAGVSLEGVIAVAEALGKSERVAVYEDIGVEMAPNSTLNSYLMILLFALRGSFANAEGGTHLPLALAPLFQATDAAGRTDAAGVEHDYRTLPVTGARILGGLTPGNVIADEILTDHPDRFRAMIIESSNPVHSVADSQRFREALEALDTVVVIEVAMTETARLADYVLPAPTQYEKPEATFFNFEFPENFFHLRQPLFDPLPGTLAEPEIHARLVEALNIFEEGELDALSAAAEQGRAEFAAAFFKAVQSDKKIAAHLPYVLYRTLGPTLPKGMAAAASLWGLSHQYAQRYPDLVRAAGHKGEEGFELGEALFTAILEGQSGTIISKDEPGNPKHQFPLASGKIRLDMAEMLGDLNVLGTYNVPEVDADFPLILAAGERRAYTANTCIRDPAWMKGKDSTQLSVGPKDAERLGLADGARARVVTKRGSAEVTIQISDRMREGTLSIPNGLGLSYPNEAGEDVMTGVSPNELTSTDECDPWARTPWHKHAHARLEAL